MPETRRKYDPEFKEGAVRIVRETGKSIAQIARDLGVHEGTLGNWVAKDRAEREGTEGLSMGDAAELKRLRAENAQLRMERDVLKTRRRREHGRREFACAGAAADLRVGPSPETDTRRTGCVHR